jgi:hypothetical protein
MSGSHILVALPGIVTDWPAPYRLKSPTGKWYAPIGKIVVIAPDQFADYRADVVSPPFAAPELWQTSNFIYPTWLGTDPFKESADNQDLFIAGLLFGIAGAAIIACAQDVTSRYRSWKETRNYGSIE